MNLIESVYELSKSFTDDPKYVFLNEKRIDEVIEEMKQSGKTDFPVHGIEGDVKSVLMELVAASINYCYWYGKWNIRPGGSSSTTMYQCVVDAFTGVHLEDDNAFTNIAFAEVIHHLTELLAIRRFPLLEERKRHLDQLVQYGQEFAKIVVKEHTQILPLMETLVATFPGFASDMFLKRASLFFIQLYRRFGWFEDDLFFLHVPADYQIPKMLNHFGCFLYDEDLEYKINTNQMIPPHSQAECEIRASTIKTVRYICDKINWNVAEVDSFFFLRRHDSQNPFHLTITTDY